MKKDNNLQKIIMKIEKIWYVSGHLEQQMTHPSHPNLDVYTI